MSEDNNSLTNQTPSAEDRKKDLQRFTGVHQMQKKEPSPVWRWITSVLLSGRKPKDILKRVLNEEIVPNIQDGIYNSVTSVLRDAIYKEGSPGNAGQAVPGSFITNYVKFSDKKKDNNTLIAAEEQKDIETVTSGFEIPAFPGREMADNFLRSMKAYVTKYDNMSVHDLAWMQGKTIDFTWEKWGWNSEEILGIKDISRFAQPVIANDGKGGKIKLTHYINMPKAHTLKEI